METPIRITVELTENHPDYKRDEVCLRFKYQGQVYYFFPLYQVRKEDLRKFINNKIDIVRSTNPKFTSQLSWANNTIVLVGVEYSTFFLNPEDSRKFIEQLTAAIRDLDKEDSK